MSVYKEVKKNGNVTYLFWFRDTGGKQIKRRGFRTKNDALIAEASERTRIVQTGVVVNRRSTLKMYLDDYYDNRIRLLREMGDNQYNRVKAHHKNICEVLGHIRLCDIKIEDVEKLREVRKAAGNKTRTIKLLEWELKRALQDGVGTVLHYSPIAGLKTIKVDFDDIKEAEIFEPEEQKVLLETAKLYSDERDDQRWYMLVFIALNTGMRFGEIAGLQWGDINFLEKQLKVKRAVEYSQGVNKGRFKEPKTRKGKRDIAITNNMVEELKNYRHWQSMKLFEGGVRISGTTQVITGDTLGILPRQAGKEGRYTRIVRKANLAHRKFHSLRHTHASNLLSEEIPIGVVSRRLGHSTISMTFDTYGHMMKKDNAKVEAAMERWESNIL